MTPHNLCLALRPELLLAPVLIAALSCPVVAADDGLFVVLIGPPAAGKAAVAAALSDSLGVPSFAPDRVLEERIALASRLPGPSKSYPVASTRRSRNVRRALARLDAGTLVDQATLDALAADGVSAPGSADGFVLRGYPGTVEQAVFLDAYSRSLGMGPLIVIYLDLPDELALERMRERGKPHDRRQFGPERLRQFRENVDGIVEFYGGSKLLTVDASGEPAQTIAAVEKILQRM